MEAPVYMGEGRLTIEHIVAISQGQCEVALSDTDPFRARIDAGVQFLDDLLREEGVIYGVTTGYGDSCTVNIPMHLVDELPLHLTRFHGCGLGDYFDIASARAILATRLCSLSQGYSGVSWELLNLLVNMLNRNIVPQIPQEGSVGASGDLTPLSYVAGALVGERQVWYQQQLMTSAEAFGHEGLTPIRLRPKEGLAVMNGTAVMTALACLAFNRASYVARLATRITALASTALQGNSHHFDAILFRVKPHQGQAEVARRIRDDLNHHSHPRNSDRLQDRYSIRCAPHIIGVLEDTLPFLRSMIENELNSANDNPIIDGIDQHVLHGGHFYGGHIALAMDTLKNCVANLADLADRQLALLVDQKFNNGLPANLSGAASDRRFINHGFKAIQIGVSAWTAEALKNTMPASVFSRSTECHNQDKVSMGTIAARDSLRVLQLTEQVMAAVLLASIQAVRLRIDQGELNINSLSAELQAFVADFDEFFQPVTEDRPTETLLRATVGFIQQQRWTLYE